MMDTHLFADYHRNLKKLNPLEIVNYNILLPIRVKTDNN